MLLHYAHNSAHYALHTALNNTVLWTVLITHTANIDSWSRSCWWQGRRWHLGVTKIVCLYVTGNLVQIHFAIWDKYILQFETITFRNLRQIYLQRSRLLTPWSRSCCWQALTPWCNFVFMWLLRYFVWTDEYSHWLHWHLSAICRHVTPQVAWLNRDKVTLATFRNHISCWNKATASLRTCCQILEV